MLLAYCMLQERSTLFKTAPVGSWQTRQILGNIPCACNHETGWPRTKVVKGPVSHQYDEDSVIHLRFCTIVM